MKKFMLGFALAMLVCSAAFAAEGMKFSVPADLFADGILLGAQRATIAEGIIKEKLGDKAKDYLTVYEKATDVIAALKLGKIQACVMDGGPAEQFYKDTPDILTILPEPMTTEQYAIAFKKGNSELREKVNAALAEIKAEGTLAAIFEKYEGDYSTFKAADIDLNKGGKNGELHMAMEVGFPPYDIKVADGCIGIDTEMCAAIARKLDMELVITVMNFDALPAAVNTGKVDMICAGITVTEDRKQNMDFSDPYVDARQVAVVLTQNYLAK